MINASLYDSEIMEVVLPFFQNAEKAIAACDFFAHDEKVWTIFATNRFLRFFLLKRGSSGAGFIGKAKPEIEKSYFLPIESVCSVNGKQSFLFGFGPKTRYKIWLTCGTEQKSFWTTRYAEAALFVEALTKLSLQTEQVVSKVIGPDGVSQLQMLKQRGILSDLDIQEIKSSIARSSNVDFGGLLSRIEAVHQRYAQAKISKQDFDDQKNAIISILSMAHVCPNCQKEYRIKPEFVGKRVKCKACGESSVVDIKPQSAGNVLEALNPPSVSHDDLMGCMNVMLVADVFLVVVGTWFELWQYWWYSGLSATLTGIFVLLVVAHISHIQKRL